MNKIKKAIDAIKNMASNKQQNVNKFILSDTVLVLEREISNIQKNNSLVCDVIDKVSILASIEINEEVDRIDATEALFKSFKTLQESCDKKLTTCHCGEKLRGIERA